MPTINGRATELPINPLILERWSPRAFTDEAISETELMTLLEAERWAPSAFNIQPWHFIYARRGTEHFGRLLAALIEFNQS